MSLQFLTLILFLSTLAERLQSAKKNDPISIKIYQMLHNSDISGKEVRFNFRLSLHLSLLL